MTHNIYRIAQLYINIVSKVNCLQPFASLTARLYVGWVFFAAGLTKIRDWETTLWLFEEEYAVPLLNPELAAWLGTAGEILLPILLVLGIGTRFSALGLSVVNIAAVLSLESIAPAAYTLHVLWGLLLAQVVIFGAGKLSLDSLINYRYRPSDSLAQ